MEAKTLDNIDSTTAKANVSDIKVFGNPDSWVLLSKASSQEQGWMKSSKAMNVPGGVAFQVSTQQGDNVAESVTFMPNMRVVSTEGVEGGVLEPLD